MANIFNILESEPHNNNWTNIEVIIEKYTVSSTLRAWLTETSLLTSKLRKNVVDYRFKVLQEYFDEGKNNNSNKIFVREVAMLSNNRPYIFGQTKASETPICARYKLCF